MTYDPADHIALIYHCIKEMVAAGRAPRDYGESVYFGYCGLLKAIELYNPARGAFSTYACHKIRFAIRAGQREERRDKRKVEKRIKHISISSLTRYDACKPQPYARHGDPVKAAIQSEEREEAGRLHALVRIGFAARPKVRDTFLDYYQKGIPQHVLAARAGLTTAAMTERVSEAVKFLKAVA